MATSFLVLYHMVVEPQLGHLSKGMRRCMLATPSVTTGVTDAWAMSGKDALWPCWWSETLISWRLMGSENNFLYHVLVLWLYDILRFGDSTLGHAFTLDIPDEVYVQQQAQQTGKMLEGA